MNRPVLILLVGIPGSGKTTYAENYMCNHSNAIHLSSDNIRKELWGNEAMQGDNSEVFSLMQKRAITALNEGQNVIYDATNITRKDRSYIISLCPKFVQIEAHIIWAPIETCIERDAHRERTVGKEVIDRMLKRFQAVYYDEGIDEIKVFLPNKFERLKYENDIRGQMNIEHDNPHHTLSILNHCLAAEEYALKHFSQNYAVITAAMWHDVGKPYVKSFFDNKGNPCETAHYYQHHCVGAWMSYGIIDVTPFIAWLISEHMSPFMNTKYYNKQLPAYLKRQIDLLHESDLAAH